MANTYVFGRTHEHQPARARPERVADTVGQFQAPGTNQQAAAPRHTDPAGCRPQGGYAGPQGGYGAPQGGYAGSGYTAPQPAFGGGPQYDPSQKSFFAKLFDLSFTSYITPSIVKIVYILTIAAVVFGWLMFAVAGFNVDTTVGLLFLLIVGPIYAFFILVLMRITLEFYVAVIRIAEDVSDLRSRR